MNDNVLCPYCNKKIMSSYSNGLELRCWECNNQLYFDQKTELFFDPTKENRILDIAYKSVESSVLSNLFPNRFTISKTYDCASMEGFLRSLTIKSDTDAIIELCGLSGINAYKVRSVLPDWRQTQTLYFNGESLRRGTIKQKNIITMAYDALFEQSSVFRMALRKYKDKIFMHSIGCDDRTQTLLTTDEYLYQLNRLKERLD